MFRETVDAILDGKAVGAAAAAFEVLENRLARQEPLSRRVVSALGVLFGVEVEDADEEEEDEKEGEEEGGGGGTEEEDDYFQYSHYRIRGIAHPLRPTFLALPPWSHGHRSRTSLPRGRTVLGAT